jgi:hypothetical protein
MTKLMQLRLSNLQSEVIVIFGEFIEQPRYVLPPNQRGFNNWLYISMLPSIVIVDDDMSSNLK